MHQAKAPEFAAPIDRPTSVLSRGAFWLMLRRIAVWAAMVDVVYLVAFALLGMPIMALTCLISIAAYAAAYQLLLRRINRPAVLIMWAEVLVHTTACTVLLGWESGLHYFLLVFIPAVAVSRSTLQANLALAFLLCAYVGLDIASHAIAPRYGLSHEATLALRWLTLAMVFTMFGAMGRDYVLRVERAEGRLQEMAATLERERIARELHDTLLQGVNGLILRFQAVQQRMPTDDPIRAVMENILTQADAVLVEGRERVTRLRAGPELGEGGLHEALVMAGEQMAIDHGAAFTSHSEGDARQLRPQVVDEAFRIGREALLNAFLHADASRIHLRLAHDQDYFRCEVRDNGRGIAKERLYPAEHPQHFGVLGMQERARRIGGRLIISTERGRGTAVVFKLPSARAYLSRSDPLDDYGVHGC